MSTAIVKNQLFLFSDVISITCDYTRMVGRPRIGPRKPRRIFLSEWREARGLSQKSLGERFDPEVTDMTVSRWEAGARGERGKHSAQLNSDVIAALAEALDCEVEDLYRHPDTPSADALLRNVPDPMKAEVFRMIGALSTRKI